MIQLLVRAAQHEAERRVGRRQRSHSRGGACMPPPPGNMQHPAGRVSASSSQRRTHVLMLRHAQRRTGCPPAPHCLLTQRLTSPRSSICPLLLRATDRLAVSKLVSQLTRASVKSPLAQCLLVRYVSQVRCWACETQGRRVAAGVGLRSCSRQPVDHEGRKGERGG